MKYLYEELIKLSLLPKTNVVVDSFHTSKFLGVDIVHVLTHFHSDHRPGLEPSFRGRLLCSEITAEFLYCYGIKKHFVEVISLYEPLAIHPEVGSGIDPFTITLIDANHCPGSVSVIIQGPDFSYFYMGDSRISKTVTHHAARLSPNGYDIVWIDSTFYDSAWDVMPHVGGTIDALIRFATATPGCLALEFELLGTEVLLEALLTAFPGEKMLVLDSDRMEELQIIFADDHDLTRRLAYHDSKWIPWDQYRFIIVSRKTRLPAGVHRVRATTQRWAGRIRRLEEGQGISIIEVDEERKECFIFFSFHSCKREIDDFTAKIGARQVVQLVKSIDIKPAPTKPTEAPVDDPRLRCRRYPFEFSNDDMWLDSLMDSQETMPPFITLEGDIVLPMWGPK